MTEQDGRTDLPGRDAVSDFPVCSYKSNRYFVERGTSSASSPCVSFDQAA
jgi:hypothetical protein